MASSPQLGILLASYRSAHTCCTPSHSGSCFPGSLHISPPKSNGFIYSLTVSGPHTCNIQCLAHGDAQDVFAELIRLSQPRLSNESPVTPRTSGRLDSVPGSQAVKSLEVVTLDVRLTSSHFSSRPRHLSDSGWAPRSSLCSEDSCEQPIRGSQEKRVGEQGRRTGEGRGHTREWCPAKSRRQPLGRSAWEWAGEGGPPGHASESAQSGLGPFPFSHLDSHTLVSRS